MSGTVARSTGRATAGTEFRGSALSAGTGNSGGLDRRWPGPVTLSRTTSAAATSTPRINPMTSIFGTPRRLGRAVGGAGGAVGVVGGITARLRTFGQRRREPDFPAK
ncbi:hypothetical protein GCM10029964_006650 [Kibdelosporangium lantanae]